MAIIVKSAIKITKGFDTWQIMVKSQEDRLTEMGIKFGAVLDNHKWGYHGTYEKESFKQAQTSPFD